MKTISDMEVSKAAGGLVWIRESGTKKVAIVHRTRYGDEWTLPKGKLKKSETWKQAAKREVSEEIGCSQSSLRIISFAGTTIYPVEGKPKVVLFWNMALEGECTFGKTDAEVDQVAWLPVEKALELLKHPEEKDLLKENINEGKLGEDKPIRHRIAAFAKSASQKRLEDTIKPYDEELNTLLRIKEAKKQRIIDIEENLKSARQSLSDNNVNAAKYLDKSLASLEREIKTVENWSKNAQANLSAAKKALEAKNFQIELECLTRSFEDLKQTFETDSCWFDSAKQNLTLAYQALNEGKTQQAWNLFHDSSSLISQLQTFKDGRLRNQALKILEESQEKLDGWRKSTVTGLLCNDDGRLKDEISLRPDDVYAASQILYQKHSNTYIKLSRAKDQLVTLSFASVILVLSCVFVLSVFFGQNWTFLTSAVLLGAIGAASSGIISVVRRSTKGKIPDQLLSSWSILIKPIFGAVSGLAVAVFLQAGIVQLGELTNYLIGAISFIAGFSERFFLGILEKSGGGLE